jgi:hypothetical protein
MQTMAHDVAPVEVAEHLAPVGESSREGVWALAFGRHTSAYVVRTQR